MISLHSGGAKRAASEPPKAVPMNSSVHAASSAEVWEGRLSRGESLCAVELSESVLRGRMAKLPDRDAWPVAAARAPVAPPSPVRGKAAES